MSKSTVNRILKDAEALRKQRSSGTAQTTTGRQNAAAILQNAELERQKRLNAATNLNQTAKNAMNRMVMGGFNPVQEAPATNRLKQGIYTDIQNKLNSQIENELHIVNDQGREKDDPAVLRAQETLTDLYKKKQENDKKLSEIPKPLFGNNKNNRFEPKLEYSPETNEYIRRVQGLNAGLAERMTQKQEIPLVVNRQFADWQHMINTPESTDSEDYVKWLEEGRRIGQYGDRELNAMLRGAGQADAAKVYAGMDDKEKSSWFNLKDQDMLSWNNAMDWLAAHPDGADADTLRAKRQHYHDELADRYYNADEFWQDEREAARNRLANLNGKWLSYTPEGERMPVNIMGRKGNYDTPEQMARMDELLYDAVMGQGAYQDEISGYEGSTFRDQHMRELNERISRAWDAYENENPYMEGSRDELFDILTGRDAAHDAERVNTLESERRYLQDQITDLDGKLSYYDQRNKYLEGYKQWNTANDTADDTQYDKGVYNPNAYRFTLSERGSNNVDDIYSFIIGGKERQSYIEATGNGWGDKPPAISKDYKGAMLLMPEEINIFKNLYEANKKDEASAFLDGLQFAINQRYLPYEEIQTREEARAFPILNSVFAQGANVVNTVMGAANAIGSGLEAVQGITNADEMGNDPASNAYAPVRYANTVQDEVASMLGPDAGKLYLNTMNTMRNVINGVLLTKMGIPAGALPTASLATFGTQIYQEKMYEHLQENRDFERANALSILDTALEVGEELLPIETMFATAGANVFVRVIANMLSEGGEELAGATAGEVLRGMITGRYAWEKRKDEIFNEGGYTDKDGNWIKIGKGDAGLAEAHKQAMREWGEQIVENTVAGAFGGGMGATYGAIQNYSENRKTGIQVNSKEGGFDTLLEAARGMDPESQTKKIADDLYKKQQKGKNISNYQAGKLARIMYEESGERIQDIIKGAMTRQVEAELKEEGASPEYAEKAAPAIAEAVTTGRTPKKADIRVIAKEDAGLVLMESYMTGDRDAKESIKKAGGEAAVKAQEALRDVLGEKPAKVGPNKGDTARLRQFAPIAKQDELDNATGPRHDNGLDAVVGGQIVTIKGRSGDNYIVVDENNNERTVSKNEVHAADERLGLVMEYADRNRNIIDDDTFQEIAFGLKDNKDMDLDDYLAQSTRAYIEYLTGGEVQNSQLAETTLSSMKAHAARMNDVLQEKGLVKPGTQQKVTPGKGTVTYNGIKAGTDEWQAMVKKAGPIKARELQLVAEIGVRLGNQFEIVEREDLPDSFGWEDKETGKIYINLAAKSSEDSRRNRSVTTIMAHELTHWLKQNSPEMYKELAQFVYKGLRESNENIVDSVYKKIGNEQAAVKRTISIADALDEIVADACDQVLTNEQTIRQLENESPNLYQKIKTFVRNFIDTVMGYTRNSKGEVITDTSAASRKIRELGQEFENELTRKWLATRAEALGRQEGNQETAEAQEGTSETRMSTREAEDQGIKDLEKALAQPRVKFSMREPVEATKDGLVAVHNMRLPELMGTLEEGGVTAPSIAVILARMGHSKYGNVSLVFKPSAIDPKQSRKNMIYGADAYTPERAHARVEQEIVRPEVKKAYQAVKGLLEGMDGNFEHAVNNWFNQYLYDDDTYYSLTEIAKTGYTNIGILAAYQKSKGNNVEPVSMDVPTSQAKAENEQDYGKLIDGLFDRGLYEQFFTDYDNAKSHNGFSPVELREKYAGIFKDILKETNRRWEIIKLEDPGMMEKIFTSNWFNEFYDYNKKGIGNVIKFDEYKTRKALQEKTNEDDLTDWLAGVIRNTLGQKGIRNNKDPFTNIGNRRSFKELHDEYTTENVVKAMYKNAQQKGEGADYFQGLMATASKEYKNLKEVKADARRLEIMDQEEYDAYIEQKSREMNELAVELSPSNPRAAREALLEAGKRYARNQIQEVVKRAFAAEGFNLTNEQLNKALDLIKEAREFKTGYFEAKPERVMDFDEIARVILPESVKDEPLYKPVLSMLDERGIPYDTYDGTDEDRLKKLNSVENVQFSTRELDNRYMRAARTGDIETMDELVKQTAERNRFTRETAYHGTDSFGFNEFDMDALQGAIFVTYSKMLAQSYTEYTGKETKKISEAPEIPNKNMETMKPEELAKYAESVMKQLWDKDSKVSVSEEYDDVFDVDFPRYNKKWFRRYELVNEINNYLKDRGGVYEFYTRPGKQLVIDAHGRSWNKIKFDPADVGKTQDLGKRLSAYELWLEGDEKAKEDLENIIKYTWKTREIAAWAKENGYDSVRINNVYDDGGKNKYIVDREWEWQNMELTGDIAIFFNPNDVKSADTITYDDDGSIVPPSERFSDEENDIRFSSREMDSQYMQADRRNDTETMNALVKAAAKRNGFDTTEFAYHGSDAFGFTVFDMDLSQDEIFVAYNPDMSATYTDKGVIKPISEAVDIAPEYKKMRKMPAEDLAEYAKTVIKKWNGGEVTDIQYVPEPGDFGLDEKYELKVNPIVPWYDDRVILRRFELYERIKDIVNPNGEAEGIYKLYTRPGKQLKIDAKGSLWREIPFVMYGSPLITDDGWYQYEDSFDQEKYNTLGLHYPTALTREVAEKAREWGFDSVRIYNVHDDGSRNPSIERSWEDGGIAGDIAIFFNPNDVKSADTITYDEEGNVIPPSERFSDNSNDLRFSTREADLEVNRWMLGLSESSLRTEQERMLWKQYKEVNGSWELTKRFIRELNDRLKGLEAKENKTAKDTFDIQNLQKQIEKWEKKRDEYEEQILKVTADEGYAAIMYRERNKMENLLNGRTEDEVRAAIDAIQAEMETVEKEMAERNAKLKELAERENVKIIRNQLNSAGLRKIAAKLKADLGSELQNKEIENRLALLALKMKQGKVDSSEIMELADMLVGSMRPAYDDYVLSELRGMTIALNDAEKQELKNRGMTVRDLQRELTGTGIRVTAGGPNTIDKNWDELTATFPQLDREANPGDMLYGPDAEHKGIMDLVEDAIRQQKAMGPDSDQVAAMVLEAVSDLVPEVLTDAKSMKLIRESMEFIAEINQGTEALDNINALFDRLKKKNAHAKATLGTLENKIVDAIEYTNELAKQHDVTAWKRERQALVERLRSEHTQKLLEEQTKYREKIERYKKAQELTADNQAARREIHMNINRMRRLMVNETDSKNIPEHMKSLAREMVGMVLKSDQLYDRKITAIKPKDRADALRMIQAWDDRDGKFTLNDLQQIPDEEVQDVIENALADIEEGIESYNAPAGRNLIENLSNYKKALVQIQDAVEKITNIIEAEQTAVIDGQKRKVSHLAYGVVADLDKSKRKGEWTGFGSKALTAAQRSVIYGNTTPVYFIKNLRNRGMDVLWNGFESAENRKGLLAEAARKHMQGLAEKYHYASWQHDKNIDVILNGAKVPMKLENIMALYATWTREQQMGPEVSQHMAQGGVYIEDDKKNKGMPHREHKEQRSHRVKQADIDRIEEMLTQEQKDYIRDVVEYLSKDMSELGNEASMAMYGIKKYNEKYYFPMKVWDGVKSARSDKGISGTQENRIAHQGWSKRRKHLARNALIIGKFTDTAVQHIDEMTNYVTFAPVIEGLNKVLNWQESTLDEENVENKRNLRVMFQQAYGKEALRYLEDWMKDLQGGVTQDQRKTLRDRLISMFKKNAVAGSLSVTLQQPLSYIRAAMLINPKYLAGALSPQYWKGSYQEMMDHSGVAVIKQMGRFDMNFGQSTRDWIKPQAKPNVYEKISDVLTAAPQAADTMTWTRMWSAVKMEQHAQHPDMDIKSDDFLNLVGKRFNEVMRRTQVYDSTLTKSSNMRSQALSMKLITSFMAEPTLSLNVLADAVMNVKQKGGKATLAKAGATYLLSAVLQAAVKGFMGAGRSPDEKKTAAENVLNKILYNLLSEANPASLIPGYSDLVEVLKNGELKDDALGVLGKLKSVYTTAQNITNPDKSKGPWRDVEDTAGQIIQLFSNIPLKNLMRDARAMYNWATGAKFADRDSSGAVVKYQTKETLMNGDNLLGVINSWLGDAGYKSSNKAYYSRMYNAMSGGNQAEAEGIREYLELAKGQDAKKIDAGLRTAAREDDSKTPAEVSQWMIDNDLLDGTSTITTQYKKGEITREDAEKLYKAADPKMKDNDVFWKLDQLDYQKETGETETGYYYRLRDAITKNKAEEIKAAVKTLLEHGITKEKIKDKLSDWKAEYIAGDSAKKVQIRDAITKAYKAAGYTANDANKTIERWNKDAKKTEPEKKEAKDTTGRWGRGNIDLNNRKVVENDDGTISTELSITVGYDNDVFLIPTVVDGKIVSDEEAIRHFEQTGQYLGKFKNEKEAQEYAEKLHNRQDWYYNQ